MSGPIGNPEPADTQSPSTRNQIIELTAEHLARYGPRAVEFRAVCEELGISPSLVNYHFRAPSELIWEAALFGYREHVKSQRHSFDRAPDGKLAVEAWVLNSIEWKRSKPGITAVIDYPMLALSTEEKGVSNKHVKDLSGPSRENVTTLGSGIYSLMTGKEPRRLSSARVAALITLNKQFAFWISAVGFGGLGAATWIAGRKPYRSVWKAFGFDADKQIQSTLGELVLGIAAAGGSDLPSDEELEGVEQASSKE
ncbi:MAG: TetR/AcrR family transcriptional regulator [Solirubrobacterales bacterium]